MVTVVKSTVKLHLAYTCNCFVHPVFKLVLLGFLFGTLSFISFTSKPKFSFSHQFLKVAAIIIR